MCHDEAAGVPSRPSSIHDDSMSTAPSANPSHASQPFTDATSATDDDDDSAYGELIARSTCSIASAEYFFEKRNGRTYHTFGGDRNAYVLPNDELERDRLDMQFWAIHECFSGRYFFAPLAPNPQAILDVGTGTGTWAIDVGERYPSASVTGTDLSPIQPGWVPPNVSFELHDCTVRPWEFSARFDLIHTQLINGFAVRDEGWEEFYGECYRNLRPGGWVESQEFDLKLRSDDNSIPEPSAIQKWLEAWNEGAGGGFRTNGAKLAAAMGKAGLVDIIVKKFKLPVGVWDKTQLNSGMLSLVAMTEHIEGLSNRIFMENLGMSQEEMKAYTDPVVREFRTKSVHGYWDMCVIGTLFELL
jgi:SAM-dependent methyltransferase